MIGHHSHKFYDIKPIYSVDAEGRYIVSVYDSDFEKLAKQCLEQKQEPRYFGASQDNNEKEEEIKSYNLMSMITGNGQTIPIYEDFETKYRRRYEQYKRQEQALKLWRLYSR